MYVYRLSEMIVSVYVTVLIVVADVVLAVGLTIMNWDYVMIVIRVDCDVLLFVQLYLHTLQHRPNVDDGVLAPTKAQQRVTLPRHRGGGRKARTPVGRLCN